MKIIKGDLITLAKDFDVIAHGCNCYNTQKAGIARLMSKHFKTNEYKMEQSQYLGDINKLGTIDYATYFFSTGTFVQFKPHVTLNRIVTTEPSENVVVVNCYTQYQYGAHTLQLDYNALTLCMKKMNRIFIGTKIGLPLIGGGLAGGDKDTILNIFKRTLISVDATIVLL
jgi:O-acetyl-ADP-ribose deacetylase (regulator of RNase III)